jgi:hypothetical protein
LIFGEICIKIKSDAWAKSGMMYLCTFSQSA